MIFVLILLALIFDFTNGFHDSSNIVATPIASGALRPRVALYLAAAAEFVGPFLFGVAVATTVGEGLLDDTAITITVVVAALASAVVWNIVTWYFGLPSSSSHALVGGLLGSAILYAGVDVVQLTGLVKILLALLISPILGLIGGFLVMKTTMFASREATPAVSSLFRRLQVLTLTGLALSHGTNDAQKTMGVIAMGLLAGGYITSFYVPTWVILISALAIAFGTSLGGWRLIRTLGGKIFRIRPVHGFASQIAAAAVILSAALFGGPVSTTQVMSTSIIGVGAAQRINMVRWSVLQELLVAWVLTIPSNAALSAALFFVLSRLGY